MKLLAVEHIESKEMPRQQADAWRTANKIALITVCDCNDCLGRVDCWHINYYELEAKQ